MDIENVKENLFKVLEEVQELSGYECLEIDLKTKPVCDLEGFDSVIYPAVTAMIEDRLGITIPVEINIFYQEEALTLNQTIELIIELATSQIKEVKGGFNE
jgi:acyl carrier protein